MVSDAHYWLRRIGFYVWHVPGVSRAWRLELAGGGYLLLTDVGGFDLPEPKGPYAAIWMSSIDEVMDSHLSLNDTSELFHWLEELLPQCRTTARQLAQIIETLQTFRRWETRHKLMEACLFRR